MVSPEITQCRNKNRSFSTARRLALYVVDRDPETHCLLISQLWEEWRAFALPTGGVVAGWFDEEAQFYPTLEGFIASEKEAMGSDLDYVDAVLTAHGVCPFRL